MLKAAGVPVYTTPDTDKLFPPEGNPHGYYETDTSELPNLDEVVVKVWPGPALLSTPIERAVIIQRDRESQLDSMRRFSELEPWSDCGVTMEEFLTMTDEYLKDIEFPFLVVQTEELDERMDEIIEYMRGDE
jgi:hypothetical protein